ncbi:MAG: hypothetical protein ABSH45_20400 [Bryobacteraceae bacterium]
MMRVDFVFFDAGGGHRAAACALREAIERQARPMEVRLMNLQELLDEIDVFRKLTGLRLQDLYNLMLKKGWTLGSAELTAGMHAVIRLFHRRQVRLLEEYWRRSRPDMVVSLIPNFNRALCQSLRHALPGTPLVTVLTDIADYPPHFWIEPFAGGLQEQRFICGSAKAVEQAQALGHAAGKVLRTSGMILSPRFYDAAPLAAEERSRARRALGFDPDRPVGLVLFGGQGSAAMREIAARLPERQLILICGHNARLRDGLRAMPHPAPLFVEGFTEEIPRYMQLADYFIGDAGAGGICPVSRRHRAPEQPGGIRNPGDAGADREGSGRVSRPRNLTGKAKTVDMSERSDVFAIFAKGSRRCGKLGGTDVDGRLVGVHDDVPSTDNARPRNVRVRPLKGAIEFAGGFADDCDVAVDSVHDHWLGGPVVAGIRILRDATAGIADAHDVDQWVLGWHNSLQRFGLGKDTAPNVGMNAAGFHQVDLNAQ